MSRLAVSLSAAVCAVCLLTPAATTAADAPARAGAPHAVILIYHHVSGDTPRSTSVTPAVFQSHLDYLQAGGFSVVSLRDVVSAFRGESSLPSAAVAITFDDAYESVYTEAAPRLRRRGWPFTVFVSTDAIDAGFGGFLSWEELRSIERQGGAIGNHSASHDHLVRRLPGEGERAWRRRVRADIERAQSRLTEELEDPLAMLAYPYGESDHELEEIVTGLGLVGFGQQSGPAGPVYGLANLPRFPVATAYADLDSLAEKLRSRPLPAEVVAPASRIVSAGSGPPTLTLSLPAGDWRREALRCYVSGQDPALLAWRGEELRVSALRALAPGRAKFNCTAPSIREPGVFYWYSYLWLVRQADGGWYAE